MENCCSGTGIYSSGLGFSLRNFSIPLNRWLQLPIVVSETGTALGVSSVDRGDDRDGRTRGQQELLGFDECLPEAKNPED